MNVGVHQQNERAPSILIQLFTDPLHLLYM